MRKTTADHEVIRLWSLKYGTKPAKIDYARASGESVGIRLNFPGSQDEYLLSDSNPSSDITWDEFFAIFEKLGLMMVYEENARSPDPTDWYRFEKRDAPPEA